MSWFDHFFEETLAVWGYLFWREYLGENENGKDSKNQKPESDEEDKIQDDIG